MCLKAMSVEAIRRDGRSLPIIGEKSFDLQIDRIDVLRNLFFCYSSTVRLISSTTTRLLANICLVWHGINAPVKSKTMGNAN